MLKAPASVPSSADSRDRAVRQFPSSALGAAAVVRVVFRYDDCSARSSLSLEEGVIRAFADCGAQVTMSVIPFVCEGEFDDPSQQVLVPLPAEKAALLREAACAGRVEVGLHGYSHQRWDAKLPAEFVGLAALEQRRRITEGKAELERRVGVRVTTFIPPWNAYDSNTLDTLRLAGFECLSASLRGPFVISPLQFLPSCWFRGVSEVVRSARRLRWLAPLIVITMHAFDFVESGHKDGWLTLSSFASTLRRLADGPHVRLLSLRQAASDGVAFEPLSLIPHHLWHRAVRNLPWRVRYLLEDQVLWARAPLGHSRPSVWCQQSYVSVERVSRDFGAALGRRLMRFGHKLRESLGGSWLLPFPY
jgi:hypothetical protein